MGRESCFVTVGFANINLPIPAIRIKHWEDCGITEEAFALIHLQDVTKVLFRDGAAFTITDTESRQLMILLVRTRLVLSAPLWRCDSVFGQHLLDLEFWKYADLRPSVVGRGVHRSWSWLKQFSLICCRCYAPEVAVSHKFKLWHHVDEISSLGSALVHDVIFVPPVLDERYGNLALNVSVVFFIRDSSMTEGL